MRKNDLKEIRKLLLKNNLTPNSVRYLENIINIFTQASPKLPDTYMKPEHISKIIGPIRNNYVIHIYGHPGSGKTAIVSDIVNSLPDDSITLWVDTSFTFSPNLIVRKDNVFVFPTTTVNQVTDIAKDYSMIVIDDFAGVIDPQNISKLISACKQNSTLLIIANQIRQMGKVPVAMRARLMVLTDITINSRRAEVRNNSAFYQLSVEYHRPQPRLKGQYTMVEITKQGALNAKQ